MTKAIILSGGKGERLKPLTDTTPKPMLPIHGKPHLEYIIQLLTNHGIDDIIFSTGYLHEKIFDYFKDGADFGVRIQYVEDGARPLGTAGAIKNCEHLLGDDPFVVFNGDILTDLNLSDMMEHHHGGITIALAHVNDVEQYGLAVLDNHNRIERFHEKPTSDFLLKHPELAKVVNAGVYIMDKSSLAGIAPRTHCMIETEVFPLLAHSGKLHAYAQEMYWLDIGTHERLRRAESDLSSGTLTI